MIIAATKETIESLKDGTVKGLAVLKEDATYEDISPFVGTGCLLSDLGFNVVLQMDGRVFAELFMRNCNALVILSQHDSKDDVIKTVHKFTVNNPYLHATLETLQTVADFEAVIKRFEEMPLFKMNTTTDTLIWGIAKNPDEEATAYTDNLASVIRSRESGDYFLLIDDEVINNNQFEVLDEIKFKLHRWYIESKMIDKEEPYHFKLNDMYDEVSLTSGKTVNELLCKLGYIVYLAWEE